MFTVEIRVNGTMVNHIYARNVGPGNQSDMTRYVYEIYRPETRAIASGEVEHKREDGIEVLTALILNDFVKRNETISY